MIRFSLFVLLLTSLAVASIPAGKDDKDGVDYLRDIKPILSSRCFSCHAAIKQKGDLRLDTVALMKAGGKNGSVIIPGKSKDSLLVKRLLAQDGLKRMPPESDGEALKPDQIALIQKWIDQGAAAPKDEKPETDPKDHWAFKKVIRPAVPVAKAAGKNAIDAFIAEQHAKHGLTPQPPAGKGLLLRRVYLDLIGLPPTQKEIDAFLKDDSPTAYEKVVDKLLVSPHYGERWGRHWMDVWRYSDWWGLGPELRNSQKHMWHWRDWIVDSLNQDKGYDRMILEMLAADELFPTDGKALPGTGFLARHYFKFNRTTWLDETIEHTGKAFLGLTINCCKCHDHKYDPISQKNYYQFRAFFEPYQVRLDQVPGQIDFEKDGIPRVFDCNLDAPTFFHTRGDEQKPDKSIVISPGLPKVLAPGGLDIEPVQLPPEGYNPGLLPFVLANHLKAAEAELATAEQQLAKANAQLELAKKQPQEPKKIPGETKGKILATDNFGSVNKELWIVGPGQWEIEKGKLLQKQDGATRAVLDLKQSPPQDFEAKFRFAILGGQLYKSVGIAFDEDGANEYMVYLTAVAGDQRVQFTYKKGGTYIYPPEMKQPRTVPLNESQEIVLRVRGTLVNVAVNGGNVMAFHLPLGRHPGKLKLITFDAAARFEQFTLAELPPGAEMVQAAGKITGPVTVALASAAKAVAEKMILAAKQNIDTLKARAAADKALAFQPGKTGTEELVQKAATAEMQLAVARAEVELAKAAEKQAEPGNKDGAAKVNAAQKTLDAAKKALADPGKSYSPLVGALKTLESNLETSASQKKPFPKTSTGRRAALAKWIASKDNPLAARVAVNHIWAKHFGQPLVATVFDFGRKGAAPTHPELLDWLAAELMENGWSTKHLHKLIVMSNTYRMTSSKAGADLANEKKDPDNHYLWRMNSQRMESQVVRDSLLYLAGEMDPTLGGPAIEEGQQNSSKRRSLYFFHSAINRNKFLTTFDEADPLDCYRRKASIVPQQALALANSELVLSMADKIAQHMEKQLGKASDEQFARAAFSLIVCYEPNAKEVAACTKALASWRDIHKAQADAEHRARWLLVHALLNHNDFITLR